MKYKDQIGYSIDVNGVPQRIISLVPSQTEFLFDLGLDEEIVGITRYCIHPKDKCAKKTKVGGTKKLDHHLINQLKPDLIIGNKEENVQKDIELLRTKYPVWMSDVVTLDDAYEMMVTVGKMVEKGKESKKLIIKIKNQFKKIKLKKEYKVVYFIWKNPYMVAGNKTFIHQMLKICGFKNLFEDQQRYPEVTLEQIKNLKPDVVILSTEPYPFSEKDVKELSKFFFNSKVVLADGEMFSWYGSRLLLAADYFKNFLKQIITPPNPLLT